MSAWTTNYKLGLSAEDGTPQGEGIKAVKHELAFNGHNSPKMKLELATFGNYATENARSFQEKHKLDIDGIVGRKTALVLFRKRARALETIYGIPDDLLCRQKSEESANDPAAVGPSEDFGLVQIVLRYHPTLSLADVINPAVCLPYAAQHLAHGRASLGDWEAALAAWNVGTDAASKWKLAGKPDSGYLVGKTDLFKAATDYVRFVRAAAA